MSGEAAPTGRLEKLTAYLAWPPQVIALDEVDSTNSYAKRLIADCSPNSGTVTPILIVADKQTAGRGRGGKRWLSDSGSLTFSLIFRPDARGEPLAERLSILPLLVGAAIAEALSNLVEPRPRVKWPNDVYVEGRKVAGILIEAIAAAGGPAAYVIGVGINCDAEPAAQDPALAGKASSLRQYLVPKARELTAEQLQRAVLRTVLVFIESTLANAAFAATEFIPRWPLYCLLTGRWVTVRSGNETIEGECLGIDEYGALLVREAGGGWRSILAGEVLAF